MSRCDSFRASASARARRDAHGLTLRPLSSFCLPGTAHGYNGLVLGYGGVPAERMDALARRIGEMIDRVPAGR